MARRRVPRGRRCRNVASGEVPACPNDLQFVRAAVALELGFEEANTRVIERMREWMAGAGRGALAALPAEVRSTSALATNLARLLQDQGKLSEAEPLFCEALSGRRRTLGGAHPDTLTSANNLALLLSAQGKLSEAEPLLREVLAGSRRALGGAHPDTLAPANNLAGLLRGQGKLSEAEPLYQEAMDASRRTLGDSHPHTFFSVA